MTYANENASSSFSVHVFDKITTMFTKSTKHNYHITRTVSIVNKHIVSIAHELFKKSTIKGIPVSYLNLIK